MHSVNLGGLGTAAAPCPPDLAATLSQWLNSLFWIESPSTVATASPRTPPQPATSAAGTKKAPSASVNSFVFLITRDEGSGAFGNPREKGKQAPPRPPPTT